MTRAASTLIDKDGRVCTRCKQYKTWKFYTYNTGGVNGHHSRCVECQKKERIKAKTKETYLFHNYNLFPLEYQQLFQKQNSKCAICNTLITRTKDEGNVAHVDHDHKTGKVRGLLCVTCNSGLGSFKDNPNLLYNAISYLEKQ